MTISIWANSGQIIICLSAAREFDHTVLVVSDTIADEHHGRVSRPN